MRIKCESMQCPRNTRWHWRAGVERDWIAPGIIRPVIEEPPEISLRGRESLQKSRPQKHAAKSRRGGGEGILDISMCGRVVDQSIDENWVDQRCVGIEKHDSAALKLLCETMSACWI